MFLDGLEGVFGRLAALFGCDMAISPSSNVFMQFIHCLHSENASLLPNLEK
jgi:hypothetical protein